MFARIDPATLEVVELWDVATLPPLFPDLDALYWPCDTTVQLGWAMDAVTGTFTAPPPQPLADVQAQVLRGLSYACELQIVAGFQSSALGAAYEYQSDRDDQLNLLGAYSTANASGQSIPFKCKDLATGVWAYLNHTPAQLAQVMADGAAYKLSALTKFNGYKAQVLAALTNAEAEAVIWVWP